MTQKRKMTIMKIPKDLLEKLETLKIHPRQPYYEIIERMLSVV